MSEPLRSRDAASAVITSFSQDAGNYSNSCCCTLQHYEYWQNAFFWTAIQYFALNCGLHESKLMLFICSGYVVVTTIRFCSCFTYKSTEQNNTLNLYQTSRMVLLARAMNYRSVAAGSCRTVCCLCCKILGRL